MKTDNATKPSAAVFAYGAELIATRGLRVKTVSTKKKPGTKNGYVHKCSKGHTRTVSGQRDFFRCKPCGKPVIESPSRVKQFVAADISREYTPAISRRVVAKTEKKGGAKKSKKK